MRTTRDIRDDVFDAVVAQVASRVQKHCSGQETRRMKARAFKEKWLRIFAKNTIRAAVLEWKKAEHVSAL